VQRIHYGHGYHPQVLQVAGVLLSAVEALVMLQGFLNLDVAGQRQALAHPYALSCFLLCSVEIELPLGSNDTRRFGGNFEADLP
jgi:hypothetical protein